MKNLSYLIGFSLLSVSILASCESDPDFDSTDTISVNEGSFSYKDGVWDQNEDASSVNFIIDGYAFSHNVEISYGFPVVYGFTPSKVEDTSVHNPLYSFPYAAAAGKGINGAPYLVAYWAPDQETPDMPGDPVPFTKRTCRIYSEDGDSFEPVSVMVCCNTYLMYAALNGTDFSKKFGPGDYVRLIAHGVHLDGEETQVSFDLINVEGSDVENYIQKNWASFNLSDLGKCTGIYFTMESNDTGASGMNVPSYFCMDQLVVKD